MMDLSLPSPDATPRRVRRLLMTVDAVGGVWRYSIDLGRALVQQGLSVTLAVMGPRASAAQRREATRAGVRLVEGRFRLEWMESAAEDVRRAGEWLLAIAESTQPDVVHLNGYAHAALSWPCPVVVVAHSCVRGWWRAVNGSEPPPRYESYTAGAAAGLAAADAVVAPTQAMLDEIVGLYKLENGGSVIPNGHAETSARPSKPRKRPLILTAGRLWDEAKNVSAVCGVSHLVAWPIYVAGPTFGPEGATLPLDGVRLLGHLSPSAMRSWYDQASIYVLPARYEPFGLSVLEAARAGCALVLGDIPSLRENWDGAALFVHPDDRGALATAIGRLIEDDALRNGLAARARSKASSLTISRTAEGYLALYESLLA